MLRSYSRGEWVSSETLGLSFREDPVGLVRGYRIFTACRTVRGQIFQKQAHIDRLFASAKEIYMDMPHGPDTLSAILDEAVQQNAAAGHELLLEIIYTGGLAQDNGTAPSGTAQLLIWVLPLKLPAQAWYDEGVHLATFVHQRPYAAVKLMFYLGGVIAHQTVVKAQGADMPLFVSPDTGHVLEGSTFNMFFVRDGVLYTPPLDGRVLKGITRAVVLDAACSLGIPAQESPVLAAEIGSYDEAFLTSSTRTIVPVRRIDAHVFLGERMVTRRLMAYLADTHGLGL
jgi:branched-chain amino acid aminotransferase